MKIALVGSAPSSIHAAPYGDPNWQIWACSPGAYSVLGRCDEFFEMHKWEPGVIGKAATQVPWFSPEYVMWMKMQKVVWMVEPLPAEMPNAKAVPWQELVGKYGSYFFTSSVAWMMAMAIERILEAGKPEGSEIGLWGIDMAANEEYADQRPGCQFFVQVASQLGINVHVPLESDLMAPPVLYGVHEHTHIFAKLRARRKELEGRLAAAQANMSAVSHQIAHLQGALDDLDYMFKTWTQRGEMYAMDFHRLFGPKPSEPVSVADLMD